MIHSKKILFGFAVILVGALYVYASNMWPVLGGGTTNELETKSIDPSTGIGGVAKKHALGSENKSSNNPSQPVEVKSTKPKGTILSASPKQEAIASSIQKEYEYKALLASNDPMTQSSWALSATNTASAWNTTTGNGTVIAVIDSGFALAHEDLLNRWHENSGETGMTASGDTCWTSAPMSKNSNSCDDDDNGYLDDWRGWDFDAIDNTPNAGATNPYGQGVAHGTEVAGLVGAEGNNGKGIASVSWNNKLMPLQALDDGGSGYTSSVVAAIYYAVDNGADVINMSLGGTYNDPALATAINYAYQNDVVVVAAAGNCGTGSESGCNPAQPGTMGYPALNKHVIAVGATTSTGARASFSSYGPALDVMAPGSGSIASTMWTPANETSAYATTLYGTSFSSPIVASYIGLLKSVRPSTSVEDVTSLVDGSASKLSSMNGSFYTSTFGHGIIDASRGLSISANLAGGGTSPTLEQTGSHLSEHTFVSSTALGSGCNLPSNLYCTVWAQNDAGYDRYLPYSNTGSVGNASWTWPGSALGIGDWSLRAASGEQVSPAYNLFQK